MKFDVNPGPLHWIERGDRLNPRIVFLHGFMGSSQDWVGIMDCLASDYHCLAFDLPGHGKSLGLKPAQYSMAGSANLIIEALTPPERPNSQLADLLVGYSMGGRLTLYLTLRFPQSFPQAQMISGSPGLKMEKDREARRAIDLIRCKKIENDLKSFLRFWYKQPLFASLWKTSLPERLIEQRLSNNPDELCRSLKYLGLGSQPNLWPELSSTASNLHQLAGELDPKFVAISKEMARCNSNIESRTLPDLGHNIPLEDFRVTVVEIRRLMERL